MTAIAAGFGRARAITPDGSVIIGDGGGAHRWEGGVIVDLGFSTAATAVSDDGSVIVGVDDGMAAIWDASNGMRNLQDVHRSTPLDREENVVS